MRPLDLTLEFISPTTYQPNNILIKEMLWWRILKIEMNWDENEMKSEIKRKYEIMNVKVEVNR